MLNKRNFAAALAAAGLIAMNAVTVFADGETPAAPQESDYTAVLKKTVTKDSKTAIPAEDFEFIVTPVTVAEGTLEGVYPVHSGIIASDLTVVNPKTPEVNKENTLAASVEYTAGSVKAVPSAFEDKDTGIYRYKVSETDKGYEDLTYDKTSFIVDVYVTNQGNTTGVAGMRVYKTDDADTVNAKENSFLFTNDYTKATNQNLHELVVTKEVKGNQADMKQQFDFETVINGQAGESFYWETSDAVNKQSGIAKTGETISCKLGNDEALTVYGLSASDTYTVNEVSNNAAVANQGKTADSYTVTYAATEWSAGNNATVTVTNTREGSIPTGLIMSAAPYVGMLGLGGVFAGMFFRKKKDEE